MKFIRSIFRPIYNSFGRTIGRILAYVLIGLLIMLLFRDNVEALEYDGLNSTLSTTYYELFSGYVDNLSFDENYVAFSYSCSSGNSYGSTSTCYAFAHSNNLQFENGVFTANNVDLVRYDYLNGNRQLIVDNEVNFTFKGGIYYSNLGNSSSLEGGYSNYEKVVIFALSFVFICYIFSRIFFSL